MTRIRFYATVFVAVFTVLFCMALPAYALLVTDENANDILGEFSSVSSDTTPVYTKGCPNNGASQIGFNWGENDYTSGGVIDTVNNRLFVADSGNSRVLVFTLTSGNLISSKIAANVLGQPNFTTCAANSGGNESAATMNIPEGLDFDATNNRLFVADTQNNRVLVFNTSSITNGMSASYELGQPSGTAFTTATAATSQSGMYAPEDVKYDSVNNRLFVAEDGNNRVTVFNTSSVSNGMNASYELGQPSGTAFSTNTTADTPSGMNSPDGLTYDSAHTVLYVAEYSNNRILTFNVATGTIANGENASYVFGQSSFTTNTATTTQSGLSAPQGLAYDPTNYRLFVADQANNRALVFSTGNITNGENASDILGQFNSPSVDTTAVYTKGCVNNGASSLGFNTYVNPSVPNGLPTSLIDTVNNRMFVSDTNNNRVLVFTLNGSNQISSKTPAYVLGQANFTTCAANQGGSVSAATMNLPSGLAYDGTYLYVADYSNNRVLIFNVTSITNGMNASYEFGQTNFTNNGGGTCTQASLASPTGLAIDTTNHYLYVVNDNCKTVYLYSTSSLASHENASYVLGNSTYTLGSGAVTQSTLAFPWGIGLDATNQLLYVTDVIGSRVMIFPATGNASWGGSGENALFEFGQAPVTAFTSSAGSGSQSGMDGPFGVIPDPTNNRVFVADGYYNRVTVYSTANVTNGENAVDDLGEFNSPSVDTTAVYTKSCVNDGASSIGFNEGNFSIGPGGVSGVIDATNHRLFVADAQNNRVLVFTLTSGNLLSSKTPANVLGQADFVTCAANQGGSISASSMSVPAGMDFDATNNRLFVADTGNYRLLVFNTSTITNGMSASYAIGASSLTTTGYYGLGYGDTQNSASVWDVKYDSVNTRLFTAEYFGDRAMVWNAPTGTNLTGENASYVLGEPNFTSHTAVTTQSGMGGPAGLAYDSADTLLYVSDLGGGNSRIMVFNVAPSYLSGGTGGACSSGSYGNGENACYVLGESNFTTPAGYAYGSQTALYYPMGLAYDSVNTRLFVADYQDNRVMVFNTSGITNGENASYVLGSPNFTTYNGGPTQSGMSNPSGTFYDSTNDLLYVMDQVNNRVMIFPATPPGTPSATVTTMGGNDACAIGSGKLYCWGYNSYGQDGLGNTTAYSVPRQVGSATNWTTVSQGDPTFNVAACGIAGGNLYCWGRNTYGELGQSNTTEYNSPVQVGTDTTWSSVSESGEDTCGVDNGKLYCWGGNQNSEDGSNCGGGSSSCSSPAQVGSATNWIAVSTGGHDVCGIQGTGSSGALYCWGYNLHGEVGNGPASNTVFVTSASTYTGNFGSTAANAIAAANADCQSQSTISSTLAPAGTYYAWFADSSTNPSSEFVHSTSPYVEVNGTVVAANWTVLTGGTLTNSINVDELGNTGVTGSVWTNVLSTGAVNHSGSSATLNCTAWSSAGTPIGSHAGNVGTVGSTTLWTVATTATQVCSTTNRLYCFQQNANPTQQNSPVQIGTDTTWTAISQGGYDTCGIDNGKLYCWGYNQNGELGLGNTTQYNTPQQVGTDTTWTSISVQNDGSGQDSACGVDNGKLYCWGQNTYGQLGTGGTTTSTVSTNQVGSATNWVSVDYASQDTCGIAGSSSPYTLYCWGRNQYAELGIGSTTQTDSPTAVALVTLNGENATDEIGEYNSNSSTSTAVWTQNGANNGPSALGFNGPQGIAMDTTNHYLYVSDDNNHRVLVYALSSNNTLPATSGGHTATYVIGQTSLQGGNTAATTQSGLDYPEGLAIDIPAQRLFVADNQNNRVMVFPTTGNASWTGNGENALNELGQPSGTAFTTGTSRTTVAGLSSPTAVAYDSVSHNLYVVDQANNRVEVFAAATITNGENASYEFGQTSGGSQFTTKATADTQSGMNTPTDLSYDSVNSRLFVVDQGNERVLAFSTSSLSDGPNATNVIGQTSFTTKATGESTTAVNLPSGVTYDALDGRLFVADCQSGRVLEFNATTSALPTNTPVAVYLVGQSTFTSGGSGAAPTQTNLDLCQGTGGLVTPLLYDSTNSLLYVGDMDNNRVEIFNATTANKLVNDAGAEYVLGQSSLTASTAATTQSGMYAPMNVNYDSTNNQIYVSDGGNNRLTLFNTASGTLATGENASDELGEYTSPSSASTVLWTAGGANNGPTALGFYQPEGIALDNVKHYLYVSDSNNNRVLVYALTTNNTLPTGSGGHTASYVIGQTSLQGANNASYAQSGLSNPGGLAIDTVNQRLFVNDVANHRVMVFPTTGNASWTGNGENALNVLGETAFGYANGGTTGSTMIGGSGIAYDSVNNNLYVADGGNSRVLVFSVPATFTNGENASYEFGQASGATQFTSSTAAATQSGLNGPNDVTYDSVNQRLFVNDEGNNRVMVFSTSSFSDGPNATAVIGQTSFTGSGHAYSQTGLYQPSGVTYDAVNGRLFVANCEGVNVLEYNAVPSALPANTASAVFYLDSPYAGGSFGTTQSQMTLCGGTAGGFTQMMYDAVNSLLYVSDAYNHRIMIFNTNNPNQLMNDPAAQYVLGQTNFTSGNGNEGGNTAQPSLQNPTGVVYDSTNNQAYIADQDNNRLMLFNTANGTLANGENATDLLGEYNSMTSPSTVEWAQNGYNNGPTALGMATFDGGGQWGGYVTMDPVNHYLYVADNNNNRVMIYALNTDNSIPTTSGGHTATYVLGQTSLQGQDASNCTPSGMGAPMGLAFDVANSRLFVVQQNQGRVLVFDNMQTPGNGMNASYALGEPDLYSCGYGNTPSQSQFGTPWGVAYDAVNQRLFVADNGWTASGEGSRVLVFNAAPGTIASGENASYVLGQTNFTNYQCNQGGANPTQSSLCGPIDVAYDATNTRLFVSDSGNSRVMVFNVPTSVTNGTSYGENASYVLGVSNFTTAGPIWSGFSQSTTAAAAGLAYDANSSRLFVTQANCNSVMVFNASPGFITNGENASYVLGQPNYTTCGSGTSQSQMYSGYVYYDPGSGRLFVSDSNNDRILIFEGGYGAPNFMQMLPD